MKKTKQILAIILSFCMLLTLYACAEKGQTGAQTTTPANSPAGKPAGNSAAVPTADFSTNVNVNRASDAAKNTIPLYVEGVGAGCTTDVKANRAMNIAVIVTDTVNPYMNGMIKGGEKAGKDIGVNVVSLSPTGTGSIEEQLQIVEAQLETGVDGIVLHAIDSAGIQPAVDACNEAGVPVVGVGTASQRGEMMRTGVDYYDTGYQITKFLCEKAGGKGGVIILEGPAGAQNAEERKQGCLDALAEYPNCTLLESQTANFIRTEGMQVMENLLQREGIADQLKIVIGCNDEMAIGAIQALKAANIQGVLVGGFDGSEDAVKAIKDGDLTVTYNTDPFGSTYFSVVSLVRYLNDGTVPQEYFIPFPSERHNPMITAENVNDYDANLAWYK